MCCQFRKFCGQDKFDLPLRVLVGYLGTFEASYAFIRSTLSVLYRQVPYKRAVEEPVYGSRYGRD